MNHGYLNPSSKERFSQGVVKKLIVSDFDENMIKAMERVDSTHKDFEKFCIPFKTWLKNRERCDKIGEEFKRWSKLKEE